MAVAVAAAVAVAGASKDCAAAKALIYLCLASLWVAGAGVAAAASIDLATAGSAYGMGFSGFGALMLKVSADAVLFGGLLAVVALLLLLRAALRLVVVTDLRIVGMRTGITISKIPRESMGSMLRDTAVIGWLASLSFVLLSLVGCLLLIALSPPKGSLKARISTSVIDVGLLGSMVLSCFVTLPSMALELWKMPLGIERHAPDDSIV